ncbi:hypothetical protein [Streptosporangium subroseum]|uniref:hypothetical protein n=1 Tax=Streptosporangium subroseum TaxID=106412 RepID=UPI0011812AEB|nr:hypothetical protein [Streptosporangium subroseum]
MPAGRVGTTWNVPPECAEGAATIEGMDHREVLEPGVLNVPPECVEGVVIAEGMDHREVLEPGASVSPQRTETPGEP